MRTLFSILIALLFYCPITRSQTPATDTKNLQAILEEVRQLRLDIRATASTIQRAQLLLYRMRLQMDAVSRATQRVEQAHTEVEQFEYQRAMTDQQLKYLEDKRDRAADSSARSQADNELDHVKHWAEQSAAREAEAQTREVEFTNQLKTEEAKLDDLQRQFDALDRKLELATQITPTR
jgi:hypothetical protein